MQDWQDKVERSTLACAATGNAIAPGESYFSALRLAQGRFVRSDFCAAAWAGVDQNQVMSWWRTKRAPALVDQGPQLLSAEVLLGIFRDLITSTERSQRCFCYVLGLLLTRRKILRLLDLETDEEGATWLLLEDRSHGEVLRLRDPGLKPGEQERVQADLEQVFASPSTANPAAANTEFSLPQ